MSKLITATVLAALLVTPVASANDTDKLLGAAAGAAVGSTIGKGDGRTIAMVAGAVIGANLADRDRRRDRYYRGSNGIIYGESEHDMEYYFHKQCRREIPYRYDRNSGARRAWIDGCLNRKIAEQREYENEAYREGNESDRQYHRE